ncbi:MAG: Do family serine endopeptidase [Candidimonas sp.]|nr:MAG: Do family serine endopeptidase [Candidimonas sp.]TAM24330.1 MAG: Do family serine endopeptidase [Candidimonas sp.]TAM75306.1 MAG: Do family serine endopeptidase [Candidimonas sp.]
MFSTHAADSKIRRIMATASVSALLAFSAVGGAHAQAPVPTLALPDFTSVVAKTEGSVVNIRTTEAVPVRAQGMGPNSNDPYDMFRWFFGPDFQMPGAPGPRHRGTPPPSSPNQKEHTVPRGVGSGFFISSDGYILTNNHVVADSNGIFVTLTNGKEYKAKVIGTDPRTDVALIKIDIKGMTPIPIGDSNEIKKGQWVLAIGSPFGLDSTVTAGIISAINRDTGDYLPFIQTDVAVNPGNSGGPLINLAGQVIGINSQIISQSGGFMGISLAIPIDEVMRVVDQLKASGKVTRGRIGVQIGQVSDDVAKAIGLPKAEGAMVSNVESGAPAAAAGVKAGDVITKFNGKSIAHWTDLPRIVGATKPDSRVPMEVWRKGKSITLQVKVAELKATPVKKAAETTAPKATPTDALGLKVTEVSAAEHAKGKFSGGVQVTEVGEPAATAGINVGDVILTVNAVDVTGPDQFAKLVSQLSTSKAAALLVLRGDQTQWVTITPGK